LLAEQAKKMRRPPDVILSTGYPTIERLRWALKLRVDDLVLKPAGADEVTSVLQRSLVHRELTGN
jgi:ActR/RegA family two-component response regulator